MPTLLERLQYWQGQRLRRIDFRDGEAYDARLRAWHNRSLHETGGVAFGLKASVSGRDVHITFGLAYDRMGREIWLAQDTVISPPMAPDPASYLVVLNPTLSLWPEGCFDAMNGVVLARITLNDGMLTYDDCAPKLLRPLTRPRLAQGESVHGNTPWEIWSVDSPDGKGGFESREVGVQTLIDTSAAGFTQTPRYFASLQAPHWSASDASRPEFAPAYFAHIAEPTANQFTFRLLLQGIARRSFGALSPVARASRVSLTNQIMTVELDKATDFRQGDPVVMLRPRADRASGILEVDDNTLTLGSSADFPPGTRVALGNLPRYSLINTVVAKPLTVLTLAPGMTVPAGNVIGTIRKADNVPSIARAGSATAQGLVLDRVWGDATTADLFRAASAKKTIRVIADPVPDSQGGTTVTLSAEIAASDWVVLVLANNTLSAPVLVDTVAGPQARLKTSPAGLAKSSRLFVLDRPLSVTAVSMQAGSIRMQVQDPGMFALGDVVTVAEHPAPLAVVLGVDATGISLQAEGGFNATAGEDHLLAANWKGASTVLWQFSQFIGVGRPKTFNSGDVFTVWTPPVAPEDPSPVQPTLERLGRVAQTYSFGFLSAKPGVLTPANILLAAEFPAVNTITSLDPDGRFHTTKQSLKPGDWIAILDSTTPEFNISEVTAVEIAGTDSIVTLSAPLDTLLPGTPIGVVNFRDAGTTVVPPPGSPTNVVALDTQFDVREGGDFLSRWSQPLVDAPIFYSDNSAVAIVDSITGQKLTLRSVGDGIIPRTVIDGGLLGLGSLTPLQPTLRLKPENTVAAGDALTVAGPNEFEAQLSVPMQVAKVDEANHVSLALSSSIPEYSLRPERASLLSAFNERFPEAFATFAQKQGLFVSWFACQDDPRAPYPQTDPPESPCGQP
jgi:hypothetical protein